MLRGKTADGKPAGQIMLQTNGVEPANPYYPDSAFASQPAHVRDGRAAIVANWQAGAQDYARIVGG